MSLNVNDILKKMIKSLELFEGITDEEALELAQEFTLQYFPKGSLIIREGTNNNKIYILKNGKLEARKAHGLSNIKLGDINSGEIVGEMSYLKDASSTATVVSTEDSDVWEISRENFDSFLNNHPHIKEKIQETMKEREEKNKDSIRFDNRKDDPNDLSDINIVL